MKKQTLLFLALLLIFMSGHCQTNGGLDISFGTNGKVITDMGYLTEKGFSVVLQTDGKIVVGGGAGPDDSNMRYMTILRYDSSGVLDPTFGTGGLAIIDAGMGSYGKKVFILPNGKMVIAGGNTVSGGQFVIARVNNDGSLDNSFGTSGITTTTIASGCHGNAAAMQSDGKFVIAGYAVVSGKLQFAVARYNTDGTIDSTFDADGVLTTAFGTISDQAFSVSIQQDGKVVVAGSTDVAIGGTKNDFAIARYNSDGSIDSTFSTDGKLTINFTYNDYNQAQSVSIQPDEKIIVAGYTKSSNTDYALARLFTDGSFDTSFGTNGKVTTDFNSTSDYIYSTIIQPDGKIVVNGNSSGNVSLARYNSNGTLDNTFNGTGKVLTYFQNPSYMSQTFSVIIQPNGKIILSGWVNSTTEKYHFLLLRYGWYNDNCADAISIPVYGASCGVPTTGNIANASQSINAISCNGSTGYSMYDVWFKFIATSTTHRITVVGSVNFNAVVDLRTGTCNGMNMDCADATGQGGTEVINQTAFTPGNTYYIRVYNFTYALPATTSFTICVTTPSVSVDEQSTENSLKIFPNPANDMLNIDIKENAKLEIINVQGQIVDTRILTDKTNNLDISKLSGGVYTLRIRTEEGTTARKLVKQ